MEIQTERLCIRGLHTDDWADMKNIFSDFSRSAYGVYDRPFPTKDDEIKALVRQFVGSGLFFAVSPLGGDRMAGYVCFHRDGDRYDLGYCFHSAYQGKGYAYESVKALLVYMARAYPVSAFTAGTAMDNTPSRRLLEKLGFVCRSTEPISFDGTVSFLGGNFELPVGERG